MKPEFDIAGREARVRHLGGKKKTKTREMFSRYKNDRRTNYRGGGKKSRWLYNEKIYNISPDASEHKQPVRLAF